MEAETKLALSFFTVFAISYLINASDVFADCNPKDFTVSDVEKSDISDTLKIMSYSFLQQSKQEESDKSASGNAIFDGVPVGISFQDKKSLAEATLKENKFNFDHVTVKSFMRTALSQVGADMYGNCLAVQTIKASVNSAAYHSGAFFLEVKWTPNKPGAVSADFSIELIDGQIDNQVSKTGKISVQETKRFRVSRDINKEVQVSVIVDGQTYPMIEIPPVLKMIVFNYKRLTGVAHVQRGRRGNLCTDQSYLVSENGSAAGPESKSCTLCVAKPPNGVLLASTAAFEGPPDSKYVHSRIVVSNELEVCGE